MGYSSSSSSGSSGSESTQNSGSFVPDFPTQMGFMTQFGNEADQYGANQYQWAQDQFNANTALTNQTVGGFLGGANALYNQGTNDLSIYNNYNPGVIGSIVNTANQYSSPDMIAQQMGQAEGTAAQAGEQARLNAENNLKAYGIDPSSGRFQALEAQQNAAQGASEAAAGVGAAQNTLKTGRDLTQQAFTDLGTLPGQAVGSLNASFAGDTGAQNAALANTQTGALTMGTTPNYLNTGVADIKFPPLGTQSTGQSQASSYNSSTSTSSQGAEGGYIDPSQSPSQGAQVDDIPARVNAGEFIMPRDVVEWFGHEKFQKMIQQARKSAASHSNARPQVTHGDPGPGGPQPAHGPAHPPNPHGQGIPSRGHPPPFSQGGGPANTQSFASGGAPAPATLGRGFGGGPAPGGTGTTNYASGQYYIPGSDISTASLGAGNYATGFHTAAPGQAGWAYEGSNVFDTSHYTNTGGPYGSYTDPATGATMLYGYDTGGPTGSPAGQEFYLDAHGNFVAAPDNAAARPTPSGVNDPYFGQVYSGGQPSTGGDPTPPAATAPRPAGAHGSGGGTNGVGGGGAQSFAPNFGPFQPFQPPAHQQMPYYTPGTAPPGGQPYTPPSGQWGVPPPGSYNPNPQGEGVTHESQNTPNGGTVVPAATDNGGVDVYAAPSAFMANAEAMRNRNLDAFDPTANYFQPGQVTAPTPWNLPGTNPNVHPVTPTVMSFTPTATAPPTVTPTTIPPIPTQPGAPPSAFPPGTATPGTPTPTTPTPTTPTPTTPTTTTPTPTTPTPTTPTPTTPTPTTATPPGPNPEWPGIYLPPVNIRPGIAPQPGDPGYGSPPSTNTYYAEGGAVEPIFPSGAP